jgi:hypothetical protein
LVYAEKRISNTEVPDRFVKATQRLALDELDQFIAGHLVN